MNELTARQRQLLISARTQLGGILEGSEAVRSTEELYYKIIELMGEIEELLGY